MHANTIALISFVAFAGGGGLILYGLRKVLLPQTEGPADVGLRRMPRWEAKNENALTSKFDAWFARTLYFSGLNVQPTTAMLLMVFCGVVPGCLVFLAAANLFLTCLAMVAGMTAMLLYVYVTHRRRLRSFQSQFPAALDLLARAVRAGESFDQAIDLIGDSAAGEPLAGEFRRCGEQLKMGLSVSAALESMSQRLGLMDVKIFSSAVGLHRDAGGNLAETLERLASVIRDRMNYHRQLRTVTGAGRLSILLIAVLGPLLFGYLFLFQPQYGRGMWEDPTGRGLLMFAVVCEVVGLIWVSRLLKTEY